MKCPVCNADLPSTAKFCGGCGTTLSAPAPPQPQPPPVASYEPAYPPVKAAPGYGSTSYAGGTMPVVTKKYKLLRLIAVVMKILAILLGAILIIAGLVMIVAGATASTQSSPTLPEMGPTAIFGGLVGGLIIMIYGVFLFVFLYAYAEWMYVFMDIEENTRMTNEMLMKK